VCFGQRRLDVDREREWRHERQDLRRPFSGHRDRTGARPAPRRMLLRAGRNDYS
jgi:hypothetical protein